MLQYYFINDFDQNNLKNLPKNVFLIYRNYNKPINIIVIKKVKNYCRHRKIKFYIANNFKLALKLKLDGVYLPSFNKDFYHNSYIYKKDFEILGSAHNLYETKIKCKQKVQQIFISPVFKEKNNNILGLYNFCKFKNFTNKSLIALGGANTKNIKRLRMLKVKGFAAINFFKKKKGP